MVNEQTYIIEIVGPTPADANRYAEELRDALRGAATEVNLERPRADSNAQDFGATLVLVLGTPVAVVLAKAFRDWLNLRNKAKLTWKSPEGELLLENVTKNEVNKILELLR